MRLQVLHIDDCPNAAEAMVRLRGALDVVGMHDLTIETVTVHNASAAAKIAFAGSPTFLVDGTDLFPATPSRALACRVYPTDNGLAGTPTRAQLEHALRQRLGLAQPLS